MPVLGKAKPEEERIEEESDVVVIVDNSVNNHIESSRRDVFIDVDSFFFKNNPKNKFTRP